MLNLVLAAFIATSHPIKQPPKKPKIETARHMDIIKPDSNYEYSNVIRWQANQTA